MITYNSKRWLEAIRHFNASYVIRRTFRMVLWMAGLAFVVAMADYLFQHHPDAQPLNLQVVAIEPSVFSLIGILLSLLMVFRTNTAYDRWWEGRKQWGALINHTRGLAVLFNGMLRKEDAANRRFFAKGISAYVVALSDHLRDVSSHDLVRSYSDEPLESVKRNKHVPNKIVNDLYARIEMLYRDGFIDGFHLNQLKPETQSFLDIQGACERIKATPIPFSHNFFIKLFILTYCSLLPFVLVPIIGFYAILLTAFACYALIGLEFISVEIEEPFGLDCNDLPTKSLARKIEGNVHEILGVEFESSAPATSEQYLVVS
ncbi:MAG: bestrophin family ion channel [Bacteroidota bacterium]